jgi:hypothetical protein
MTIITVPVNVRFYRYINEANLQHLEMLHIANAYVLNTIYIQKRIQQGIQSANLVIHV